MENSEIIKIQSKLHKAEDLLDDVCGFFAVEGRQLTSDELLFYLDCNRAWAAVYRLYVTISEYLNQ